MRKYSIVGLSLMVTSAITAAFTPSRESGMRVFFNGILSASSNINSNPPDITCRGPWYGEFEFNCSYTVTGYNSFNSSTDIALNSNSMTDPGSFSGTSERQPAILVPESNF